MIYIQNEPDGYFGKVSAESAAIAMRRLSYEGLVGWLKCVAGHSNNFQWKYPNLTDNEKIELIDQGFLIPIGSDYEDCEFDAMGGYRASIGYTQPTADPHYSYRSSG